MKRLLMSIGVLSLVGLGIGLLIIATRGDEETTTESEPFVPNFEEVTCPPDLLLPQGETVDCGYLTVLENRRDPSSNRIRLFTAIVRANSDHPQSDPVVFVTGGPGVPATESLTAYQSWFGEMGLERDVIFFNQRGTRYSEPYLACPEFSLASFEAYASGFTLEEGATHAANIMLDCRAYYLQQGIDLSTYQSADNAADFEDLRIALGYDQWNLYGISYGTRLSLTIMRDFPDGLRSVIIDSVDPPAVDLYEETPRNGAAAIMGLFEICAADAACNTAYPDLERVYFDLLERLNAEPLVESVYRRSEGRYYTALVDGHIVNGNVFYGLYSSVTIGRLPWIIYEAYEGNYEPLRTELLDGQFVWDRIATGMHYAVNCNEEIAFDTLAELETASEALPEALRFHTAMDNLITWKICEGWDAPEPNPIEDIEDEVVVSDVPTLLLAGELDPITPARWAIEAAETLENSFLYVVPGGGHSVSTSSFCVEDMMVAFLDDPTTDPTDQCRGFGGSGPSFYVE